MEDVGRHNAVDKIAGYMFLNRIAARGQDLLHHRPPHLRDGDQDREDAHPVLVSRSGFTAWGVELARKANLTLIGRARGKRFVALAGIERIVFDAVPSRAEEEDPSTHAGQPGQVRCFFRMSALGGLQLPAGAQSSPVVMAHSAIINAAGLWPFRT